MKNTNKKGFTIVELVIVIAVIAVLAAVLIPTFVNLVSKANVSVDVQLVRNLNTALATDKAEHGKHTTMHDVVHDLEAYGFIVTNLKLSEGNTLLWDSVNDVFCLYDGNTYTYVPEDIVTEEQTKDLKEIDYYCADNRTDGYEHSFSVYYTGDATEEIIVKDRNFDAGHSMADITVEGGKTLAVRVYGGKLTVKSGTVTVYGFVYTLTKNGGTVIAAAGTQFHGPKANVTGIDTDEGALFDQHLYINGQCALCEAKDPVHVHTPGDAVQSKPDEEGYYTVSIKCKECDYVFYNETFQIKTEKETITITVPGEKETITIKVPGETIIENCEHIYTESATELTKPNCTTPGVNFKYCTECGHTKFETTSALGHDWKEQGGQDATCTTNGYSAYQKCKTCHAVKEYNVIAKLGHDLEDVAKVEATCTAAGKTAGHKCTRDGCTYTDGQEIIDKLEHDLVTDKAVAATCKNTGLTEGKHCSVCGEVVVKQDVTPKTDSHTFSKSHKDGYKCTVCGEAYRATVRIDNKFFGELEIIDKTETHTEIAVDEFHALTDKLIFGFTEDYPNIVKNHTYTMVKDFENGSKITVYIVEKDNERKATATNGWRDTREKVWEVYVLSDAVIQFSNGETGNPLFAFFGCSVTVDESPWIDGALSEIRLENFDTSYANENDEADLNYLFSWCIAENLYIGENFVINQYVNTEFLDSYSCIKKVIYPTYQDNDGNMQTDTDGTKWGYKIQLYEAEEDGKWPSEYPGAN